MWPWFSGACPPASSVYCCLPRLPDASGSSNVRSKGFMDFTIRDAIEADAGAISALVTGWARRHLAAPQSQEAAPFLASLTVAATLERMVSGEFRYYVALNKLDLCGVIAIRDT